MKSKQRTVKLSVKAVGGDGIFEGYASVFGEIDSYNDMVMAGAFAKSLSAHNQKGTMPKLLWQHKSDEPIGKYIEMYEDEKGLFVKGQLLIKDDPLAARAYAHLKAGNLDGLSIGYEVKDAEWDEEAKVLKLTELDLWETSIVTFPALASARVSDVKTQRDLEKFVRAAGCCSQKEAKELASNFDPKTQRDVVDGVNNITKTIRSLN